MHLHKHSRRAGGSVHVAADLARAQASAGRSTDRPVRVMQGFYFGPDLPPANPFTQLLVESMPPEVSCLSFSWRRAVLGGYDVFHAHWPEYMLRADSVPRRLAKCLLTVVALTRMRLTRTPVVRTLHNADPHEPGGWAERRLLAVMDRATSTVIVMAGDVPARFAHARVVRIPHGHYRTWFPATDTAAEPGRIACVGLLKAYKGVDTLLEAFAGLDDPDARLTVAGAPNDRTVAAAVVEAARHDERIEARLQFLPDQQLADVVRRAQVLAFPYAYLRNSGAVLLALSLDRPALLPAGPVADDLVAEFGEQWCTTFDPPLASADLARALAWSARPRAAEVDMSGREWADIGRRHAEVYRARER